MHTNWKLKLGTLGYSPVGARHTRADVVTRVSVIAPFGDNLRSRLVKPSKQTRRRSHSRSPVLDLWMTCRETRVYVVVITRLDIANDDVENEPVIVDKSINIFRSDSNVSGSFIFRQFFLFFYFLVKIIFLVN